MKRKLVTLIAFMLTLTLTLPAWASDNLKPQMDLEGPAKKVWFWNGKEMAVVSNGEADSIYIRDVSGKWSTRLVLGGAQVYNTTLNIMSINATAAKMYMATEQSNEIEFYSSTDGINWDSVVMIIPDRNKDVWLTPFGVYDMLINTDQGFLVRYQDYNANWNMQLADRGAPWDNVTVAGDKIFAVIDGQLQVSKNLNNFQQTGFRIDKTVMDANTYDKIGGKAVPSINYADDQTVAAFNPAQPGTWILSKDGGNTWIKQDKDKIATRKGGDPFTITAMAVAGNVMFAGTNSGYIFYSTDGGEKWDYMEIGGKVTDLAFQNNVLLAATNKGVFRLNWEGVTEKPAEEIPADHGQQSQDQPGQDGKDTQPLENIKFVLGQKQYLVGNKTFTMDVASMSREGRIYLPVRYLALALGVPTEQIEWADPAVTLTKGSTQVKLNVNSDKIQVNDKQIVGNKPLVINGRTLLPARWVAEAFDYTVNWDAPNNTMHILPN